MTTEQTAALNRARAARKELDKSIAKVLPVMVAVGLVEIRIIRKK